MSEWARIVAPQGDGAAKTQGTKVMVGDKELRGVQKIILTADVNSVWKAEIHCIGAGFTDLAAEVIMHKPSIWQRIKGWFARS